MNKLSVVMPGYNEGERIYTNLLHTCKVVSGIAEKYGLEYEIIFVNDGSSDNTYTYAEKALKEADNLIIIDRHVNQGKGAAIKCGVEKATGTYISFLDSDLDLPPEQLDGFLERLINSDVDVVVGSKLHPDSKTNYPTSRKIVSTIYYMMLVVLFGLHLRDTQTGIKLFKSSVIKPVMKNITVSGFAYDIEVLATINKLKYVMVDAPIILDYQRGASWGRIKLSDVTRTIIDTLAVCFRITFKFDKSLYPSAHSKE